MPACSLACAFLLLSAAVVADEDYSLYVSVGETSIGIESGNLTASVTYAWPSIIFTHTVDMWSPHFDVSFPKMYLFNDTDMDNSFARSETVLTAYLDDMHMSWNISVPDHGYDPQFGQYAMFGMWGNVSLYLLSEDEVTVVVPDWALVSFWFWISQNATEYSNSIGEYSVSGRLEMRSNMTLRVLKPSNATGIALEQYLRGGGETNMFQIKEASKNYPFELVEVSGRVDETELGPDFSHVLANTDHPMQELYFAKDDGTVQAGFRWNSESSVTGGDAPSVSDSVSSYYTTGTGLMLHSTLELPGVNCTVTRDCIVSLVEEGFSGTVRDWVKDNIVSLTALTVLMVGATVVTVWFSRIHRKHDKGPGVEEPRDDVEKPLE